MIARRLRRPGRGRVTPDGAPPPLLDTETMRQLERLSLTFLDAIVTGVSGQRAGPAAAAGSEFADYRHYAPGDDLRRIDWHLYGRLRELMIKVAPEEGHVDLAILIDGSGSMDSGHPSKLWHARRLGAVLGAVALLRADSVRVHSCSDGRIVSSDRLDAPRLLVALAREIERLPAGTATDLLGSVRGFRRLGERPDLAVLISDGLAGPDGLGAALAELAASARSASLLHVTDPLEAAPRFRGAVRVRDRETGETLEIDVGSKLADAYAERARAFPRQVATRCAAAAVRYLEAPTAVAPLDLLAGGRARPGQAAGLVRS